ncbi:uncharacterized protein LOC142174591 [Nicotiana tabacum]|uniref:Uncharacterized protein LOC142174591 n=1 Tax=Nicotiana tabacum TaxID=4097 RepID=A0AC58TH26_TOBAC
MAKFQICLDLKKFQEYLSSSPIFGFKNLKVLTLGSVDVDNQVVNIFLSSCPLLEQLSIRKSQVLKHLEIGPSLKLKHLEIYECDIHYLEICNVNLVSFYFYGSEKTNLRIENVSSIVNLEIEIYYGSLPRLIDLITTKFTQLVKLPLEVKTSQYEVKWTNTRIFDQFILDIRRQNPYQHLKVVRYGGYLGGTADKEFLKKSLALEKAIVRPCDHSSYSRKKSSKVERRSRSRAWRQLQGKVPKGVELVIL